MAYAGMAVIRFIVAVAGISFLFASVAAADAGPRLIGGVPENEAMRLGESMYREGILPSGEPMKAIVQGDIPVEGSMFSCASCHMKSGLGAIEGTVITLPTNGRTLSRALLSGQDITDIAPGLLPGNYQIRVRRPAYTDETLASALRAGVDPAGRSFDPVMPRYMLTDREAEILVNYLWRLSNEHSPGVTESAIRFATVFSDRVPKEDFDAAILPLEVLVRDRAARVSYMKKRSSGGRVVDEMDKAYASIVLDRWELRGDPAGWRSQLEEHYGKKPVFALLGGIAGDWRPVHEFCEQNRIPCIFPAASMPVISETDWYTLYFSKGPVQESEAAARFLLKAEGGVGEETPVVQIVGSGRDGRIMADAFSRVWIGSGRVAPQVREHPLENDDQKAFWKKIADLHAGSVIVVWSREADLSALEALANSGKRALKVFLSAGLLGQRIYALPEKVKPIAYFTYPFRLPQDGRDRQFTVVRNWLKVRNISSSNIPVSADMYTAGTLLGDVLMHMKGNFYRDYFLDLIDMMKDQVQGVVNYPRLSFGPGQRYASKGCYIVQLTAGPNPQLVKRSDWVIY